MAVVVKTPMRAIVISFPLGWVSGSVCGGAPDEAAIAGILGGAKPAPTPEAAAEIDTIRHTVASLTPTQLKVLLAVLDGQLNKQIAFALGISEATVKAHMTAIMRKLDVQNRTQAALVARSLGLDLKH